MASELISLGQEYEESSYFYVDSSTVVSLFTEDGSDVVSGPVFVIKRMSVTEEFIAYTTSAGHMAVLSAGAHQLLIDVPGDYVVIRPDITPWGMDVGVEVSERSYNT